MSNRLRDDNTDTQRLTPTALVAENEYIQQLQDEMKRIDEELTEAEAKNRLYFLLGERTRWVRPAIVQRKEMHVFWLAFILVNKARPSCGPLLPTFPRTKPTV